MIPVTIDGIDCLLIHYTANWAQALAATFGLQTEVHRSIKGRELRQPLSGLRVTEFSYNVLLYQDEQVDFRQGLLDIEDQPVLVPFWPGGQNYADGTLSYYSPTQEQYFSMPGLTYYVQAGEHIRYFSSSLWLVFEPDYSQISVYKEPAGPSFTPSSDAIRVPLLMGYLSKDGEVVGVTDDLATCKVTIRESSADEYALQVLAFTPQLGPQIEGRDVPIFPVRAQFDDPAYKSSISIDRKGLGYVRESAVSYYGQPKTREGELIFSASTWDEISALVSFFADQQGDVKSFWLPFLMTQCRLTQDVAASDTVLHVDRAAGLGVHRFLALLAQGQAACLAGASTTSTSITLASAVPLAFKASQTTLCALALVRFAKPELRMSWVTDMMATAEIRFVECAAEYDTTGTTYGEDIGPLPMKAFLYHFTREGETTVHYYFTSHERDLTYGGQTYLHRPMEHDSLEETLEPDEGNVTIKSVMFDGNPMGLHFPFQLEYPLKLDITEGTVVDDTLTDPLVFFTGELDDVKLDGQFLSGVAGNIFRRLENQAPPLLVQQTCNVCVYSAQCGLDKADWEFQAEVTSYTGTSIGITALTRVGVGAITSGDAHYFALGTMMVSGVKFGIRSIYESSTITAGSLIINLDYPLPVPLVSGDMISLWPGCDGYYPTCQEKFDNAENFRAFPFMPIGNPTLAIIKNEGGSSKK